MPHVLVWGDNSFGNIDVSNDKTLAIERPRRLDFSSVEAVCWSQTVFQQEDRQRVCRGLPLDFELDPPQIRAWLGQDRFNAVHDAQGYIQDAAGRRSASSFSHVALNGRGELLVVVDDHQVLLYSSLDAVLAPSLTDAPTALKSPLSSASRIASLDAGAGHFLLITAGPSPQVLSYGDNRFSQLGVPPSSATAGEQLCHVDFFDGLEPIIIRAGGLHSAVVTADGSLYMFGDDAKGQCGGFGGQPPALVSLVGEVDQGLSDDEPEVRDVALGSAHTVVITDKGVYVTGSNHAGQLGLGNTQDQHQFVQNTALPGNSEAISVACGRWNTLLSVA